MNNDMKDTSNKNYTSGLYRMTDDNTVRIYNTKRLIWKYIPNWLNNIILKFKKPDHVFIHAKLSSVSFDDQENYDDMRKVEVIFDYEK